MPISRKARQSSSSAQAAMTDSPGRVMTEPG